MHAATLNVNNNLNRPAGHYATIAEAVTVASAGDVLLIHPSETSYSGATINKRLEIIGAGYYTRNKERNWITNIGTLIFGQITGSSSSGSIIRNCKISSIQISTDSFLIQNNEIYKLQFSGTNLRFEHNIHYSSNFYSFNVIGSNCVIKNNLFMVFVSDFYISSNAMPSIIFTNNVLIGTRVQQTVFARLQSVLVSNNIFYRVTPFSTSATSEIQNNTFSKNVTYATDNNVFQGGIGNILLDNNGNNNNLVNIDPLFNSTISVNVTSYYTLDCRLQATSPCRNAGTDGTDIGSTGGGNPIPYPLSGEPRLGIIKTMTFLNPVVPVGGTLRVQLTAKTHN